MSPENVSVFIVPVDGVVSSEIQTQKAKTADTSAAMFTNIWHVWRVYVYMCRSTSGVRAW